MEQGCRVNCNHFSCPLRTTIMILIGMENELDITLQNHEKVPPLTLLTSLPLNLRQKVKEYAKAARSFQKSLHMKCMTMKWSTVILVLSKS